MFAGVFHDDIYQFTPEQWDSLKLKGSYMYWYFTEVENLPEGLPYFEMSEYEAMGWKFYQVTRGFIYVWAHSNLNDQFTPEQKATFIEHPKKNKMGDLVDCAMRYKYELTEEDKLQGLAFGKVIEPYVHRALESQAQREGSK
jgi:hypothetical protein